MLTVVSPFDLQLYQVGELLSPPPCRVEAHLTAQSMPSKRYQELESPL